MEKIEDQGLVLRFVDYKGSQRIVTVFTEKNGLISLIVKGLGGKRSDLFLLTSPLTLAEFHCVSGRGELYRFKDATILSTHLELREQLPHLQAAGDICLGLLKTQLPGKPAPALYQLTLSYIKRIPAFKDPKALVASFFLKLLKHEGVLSERENCIYCNAPVTHLSDHEMVCALHANVQSTFLSEEERRQFFVLLEARGFSILETIRLSDELFSTIRGMVCPSLETLCKF
jgi:DNA repair protein RecO (recombination protein O)